MNPDGLTFDAAFADCPVVAILRGITPAETVAVGDALVEAGVRLIEVPLNSPDPFRSIEMLAHRLGRRALVGAGTVLDVAQVERVAAAGGRMVVSPNANPAVIRATIASGMTSLPGYFTVTEAFAALAAGATALKLFPADAAHTAMLRAQRAVLPATCRVLAVGGVTLNAVRSWREAGADGFGLGSNIYRPGDGANEVLRRIVAFVSAIKDNA